MKKGGKKGSRERDVKGGKVRLTLPMRPPFIQLFIDSYTAVVSSEKVCVCLATNMKTLCALHAKHESGYCSILNGFGVLEDTPCFVCGTISGSLLLYI
jgi:hypothetical protein